MKLNSKIPNGPLHDKWTNYKSKVPFSQSSNKRNLEVIVVWTWPSWSSCSCFSWRDG